jgi:CHAT domain-containing protein
MTFFYDALSGSDPGEALSLAQQWMRTTTDGEKAEWIGARAQRAKEKTIARLQLLALYGSLSVEDPQQRKYALPYYWAGYQLHGLPALPH